MNRLYSAIKSVALFGTLGVLTSFGITTTIDFESYADEQNLNGVNLGGVTLTAPAGNVEVYANNRNGVSYHSGTNAIGNVFGRDGNPPWGQDNPLTGVFDCPTSFVSLWGGDVGIDYESWELKAFDKDGVLIGQATTVSWLGNPYKELKIDTLGLYIIKSFEARHIPPLTGVSGGMGFDDLSFDCVPDGGITLMLLGIGVTGLAFLRRKLT